MLHGKYPEKVTPTNRTETGEEVEGSLTSFYRKEIFPRFWPSQPLNPNAPWNYALLLSIEVLFTLGILRDDWCSIRKQSLH